jgi:hypothetical protein
MADLRQSTNLALEIGLYRIALVESRHPPRVAGT